MSAAARYPASPHNGAKKKFQKEENI